MLIEMYCNREGIEESDVEFEYRTACLEAADTCAELSPLSPLKDKMHADLSHSLVFKMRMSLKFLGPITRS